MSPSPCIFGELRAQHTRTIVAAVDIWKTEVRASAFMVRSLVTSSKTNLRAGAELCPWALPVLFSLCPLRLLERAKSHVRLISARVCLSPLVPWVRTNISTLMLPCWTYSWHSGWYIEKTVTYQNETKYCSHINQSISQSNQTKTVAEICRSDVFIYTESMFGVSCYFMGTAWFMDLFGEAQVQMRLCWCQSDESLLVWQEGWDQELPIDYFSKNIARTLIQQDLPKRYVLSNSSALNKTSS